MLLSPVLPGLDALALGQENALLDELRPLRLGILSNPTGRTQDGRSVLDVCRALDLNVAALFSPEHGPRADREGAIESSRQGELPVHSLYGSTRRPTPAMLDGLNAVLVDLQDVGARFYTYSSTLFHLLEEAIPRELRIVVLDRPNPLGGQTVEGPLIEEELRSFIGLAPLPVTHGMTMGELAGWFLAWRELDASFLRIAKVRGWNRSQRWPETGLQWRQPSPNLPNFESAAWYPGLALLEFSGLSVGRGTEAPFQVLAAPWLNVRALSQALEETLGETRITFEPLEVVPTRATFEGQLCQAIRFESEEGVPPRPVEFGMRVMSALRAAHPDFSRADWNKAGQLLGSRNVLDALWNGELSAALERANADARMFEQARRGFLKY